MMWDQVIIRVAALVQADSVLLGIYGSADHMRMAGTGDLLRPSLEWTFIGDTESELWSPCTFQFDQWCESMSALIASERRLRALFHTSLPIELDGLRMWAEYLDGQVLATPDRNDVDGRAVRFRFTPIRSKYIAPAQILSP